MIKDILTENVVLCDVEVKNWREAAQAAGGLLVRAGKVHESFIDSMIQTVEKFGPYMILVPKVCFFHGEPNENVKEACLSLCVLKNPVYFDDFDHQQINCAFAFGAVDKDSHMEMIMNVAKILQNEQFIEAITNNYPKEKIMEIIQKY